MSKSPTQVWLILNVTLIFETTAPAGMPLNAIGAVTIPTGSSSGMIVDNEPEACVAVTLAEVLLVIYNACGLPLQTVAVVGLTVATRLVTVSVALSVTSISVQEPINTTRYW